MKLNKLLIIALALITFKAEAQLGQPKENFTKGDTLRGNYNSPLRACYDINYYHLDVKFDIANKFISGNVLVQVYSHAGFQQTTIRPFLEPESRKGGLQRPGTALYPRL